MFYRSRGINYLSLSGYIGYVKKARIAEAKNNLSKLLETVKKGESVLILDRNTPIARLEPIRADLSTLPDGMADLIAAGAVSPSRIDFDVDGFLGRKTARLPQGASAAAIAVREREEGP